MVATNYLLLTIIFNLSVTNTSVLNRNTTELQLYYNCDSKSDSSLLTASSYKRGVMLKEVRRSGRSTAQKRQVTDAYYDFLINEGSFKFWAVFQMVTIAILLYSTFAAIYYAKYTYLHEQPSENDDLWRSGGRVRSRKDLIRILKAIHTPPVH